MNEGEVNPNPAEAELNFWKSVLRHLPKHGERAADRVAIRSMSSKYPDFKTLWTAYTGDRTEENFSAVHSWVEAKVQQLSNS